MKILGIVTVSLVTLLVGAKLVLAAFATVLPPDFDRKWDELYESAYWQAFWQTGEHVEFFLEKGRWATSVADLMGREKYADWRERNPEGWRSWVDQLERESRVLEAGPRGSTAEYRSLEIVDNRAVPTDDIVCTVTVDAEFAQAYDAWYSTPGARASTTEPDEISRWSRTDCRRTTGIRAWLAWAGMDRLRKPPPERYSALEYAERAWERAGIQGFGPPGDLDGQRGR